MITPAQQARINQLRRQRGQPTMSVRQFEAAEHRNTYHNNSNSWLTWWLLYNAVSCTGPTHEVVTANMLQQLQESPVEPGNFDNALQDNSHMGPTPAAEPSQSYDSESSSSYDSGSTSGVDSGGAGGGD